MHEEMIAIMNRRFMALNPHKKREVVIMQITTKPTTQWTEEELDALYTYEQEVDDDGRSLKEIDEKCTTRDPAISRQELEVQAAETYLEETWGIKRKQTAKPPTQHRTHKRAIELNPNPELSFKELQHELQMIHNSYKAITEAVVRAIAKGVELRKDPPWPMEACAAKYEIVKAKPKKGKDHPTPAACKYKKIYEEIED
jgi:isopenicillin N synthase-like dioxygenase